MSKTFFAFIISIRMILSITDSQDHSELGISRNGKLISEELIDKTIKDVNGEVCAGLIIFSNLKELTYSSYNQIVKKFKCTGRISFSYLPMKELQQFIKLDIGHLR